LEKEHKKKNLALLLKFLKIINFKFISADDNGTYFFINVFIAKKYELLLFKIYSCLVPDCYHACWVHTADVFNQNTVKITFFKKRDFSHV
jgi:hypothetical protein